MTDNDDKNKRGGKGRAPAGPRSFQPRGEGRPPRAEGERPPRRDFGDRSPRRDGDGERKPFRKREDGEAAPRSFKPRGDRPPRADGDRPPRRDFGDRPPRRDFGDRPPRRDGDGERKPFRKREDGDAAPRSFKPRGERSFGDRPPRRDFGDRPPRRDFGDRPPRRDGDGERKPFRKREEASAAADDGNRIAKVIARAGLCSRRDAEAWIEAGRVAVNGVVIESPALDVLSTDKIEVDGVALPERERTRLWLYHKPKGLETTEHSPEGRPTVFDNLPEGLPRVMSVGRLDINTEGLLLLTNDGGLARVLAHPKTAWLRRYRVRVFGPIDQAQLDTLRDGITLTDPEEGEVTYAPIVARLERSRGDNSWLTMDLREGKNREIKKVLEHFGLQVTRLIRISFGPFQLGDMPEGTAEEIRGRYLRDQLGERLAAEAEADFDGPVFEHLAQAMDAPKKRDDRRAPAPRERSEGRSEGRPFRERDGERKPFRDRFAEDDKPERGSPQDREGRSKTAWSNEPLPERRRDSKKPGQKRDAALLGARPDLKVTKERVADRKGREVRVERVARLPREDDATEDMGDPNRRFGKRRETFGDRPPHRDFGDRPPRRDGDGERPRSFRPREDGERKPFRKREDGEGAPRSFKPRGDRPFTPRDGDRPPRRDFGDRPPRRDGDGEHPRSFRPREDGERKPFRKREDGEGAPRSFKPRGDRPFTPRDGDRPPRRDFGDRPPRRDGDRPFKPRDGKPGGGRPFGGKPGWGRPGGKPGGFRPGGGRPGGGGADRRR